MQEEMAKDVWVIFRLKQEIFGLPAFVVREMVNVPHVTQVPRLPVHVRGTINLRGQILPILDLRTMLGFESADKEVQAMVAMLKQREEDHHRWIDELENSTREKREFKLTTDPTQCAFGKWYYQFQADNLILKGMLKKFEEPHNKIHALGKDVLQVTSKGQYTEAMALIREARNGTLQELVKMFGALYDQISRNDREVALIAQFENRKLALAVDAVVSVETVEMGQIDQMSSIFGKNYSNYVSSVGRRKNNLGLVMLLDREKIS